MKEMEGRLLICGSARCVWDDLSHFQKRRSKEFTDDVMCINDMIMFFPGDITHCVSCDAPMLPKWWAARRPPYLSRYSKVPRFHTVESEQGVPNVERWHFTGGGTSGLLACHIAIELGYDEIVLCGIPIDNSGHFWEREGDKTNFQREIVNASGQIRGDGRRFWTNRLEEFDGRVKSMSGNTRLILGAPT